MVNLLYCRDLKQEKTGRVAIYYLFVLFNFPYIFMFGSQSWLQLLCPYLVQLSTCVTLFLDIFCGKKDYLRYNNMHGFDSLKKLQFVVLVECISRLSFR